MKNLFSRRAIALFGVTAALSVAALGSAEAAPISFDYTFDPADVVMRSTFGACTGNVAANSVSGGSCGSLQFTYTLAGYVPATDTLASGTLSLTFYDDNFPPPDAGNNDAHFEYVNISLDSVLTLNSPVQITTGSTAGSSFSTSFNVLTQLQDGQLTVLLSPSNSDANNDFFFASSRLTARGERQEEPPPGSAPEPGSMLLLGTAAAGLFARRMRRKDV